MKNLLAIETSTPVCSVALQTGDSRTKEKRIEGRGVHSEYTVQFIEDLLQRADLNVDDLDAVLFSNGPGSYTGLRIGSALIKGLLFGKDVPLYIYPTLISFACGQLTESSNNRIIHSVIDARRNHLYYQQIRGSSAEATDASVLELEQITQKISNGDVVIGTGWDRLEYPEREAVRWIGLEGVSAVSLIYAWNHPQMKRFYKQAEVETFEPEYLTMAQINNSPIKG
jgi:tRNA threonylcarbamoyladenosine biosynthesis protein TsaB